MGLFKNPAQVIIEAGNMDLETSNNIMIESAANEFEEISASIPTLEEGTIFYTEEVVPVFEASEKSGVKGVIELESVVKFMDSNDIENIEEAVERIADHYGLQVSDLGVVIESAEELEEIVQEAKKAAKKGMDKKLIDVGGAAKMLKNIKNKGVKIFKKDSSKKKKGISVSVKIHKRDKG